MGRSQGATSDDHVARVRTSGPGRVFYTSLGKSEDFAQSQFRRRQGRADTSDGANRVHLDRLDRVEIGHGEEGRHLAGFEEFAAESGGTRGHG